MGGVKIFNTPDISGHFRTFPDILPRFRVRCMTRGTTGCPGTGAAGRWNNFWTFGAVLPQWHGQILFGGFYRHRGIRLGLRRGRLYPTEVMVERRYRDWEAASVSRGYGGGGFNAESAKGLVAVRRGRRQAVAFSGSFPSQGSQRITQRARAFSFLPYIFVATGAQNPDHAPRRLSQPRRAGWLG